MSTTMETVRDEGGDDRHTEVALARLNEFFDRVYPAPVSDEDIVNFMDEEAAKAQPTPEDTQQPQVEKTPPKAPAKAPVGAEGGRALYGYEPNTRHVGSVAIGAMVQSGGFRPAGLPGGRHIRSGGRPRFEKRPSRYPRINGIF